MKIALIREVSSNITDCEITNITRKPIDPEIAREQHQKYIDILIELGCKIHLLKSHEHLPDSVFVEDTAIVLDEIAVITRPGATSRRAETEAVSEALHTYRDLEYIKPSGTLDGGDVLKVGSTLYVGKSCRSSAVGIGLLREIVKPYGYEVRSVQVNGCLHLKSAISIISSDTALINPSWVNPDNFEGISCLPVDPSETYGANALNLEGNVIYSTAFPKTRKLMERKGFKVISVDISELAKAEGNISCCSIVFDL